MRPRTAPVPRATRPRATSQRLRAEHRRLYATPHLSLGYYVARLQSRHSGSGGQALDGGRRDPATNADRHAVLLAPAHNPWNAATGASACAHASAPFLPPVATTPMSPPTRPLRCSASRARGWARSRGPSPALLRARTSRIARPARRSSYACGPPGVDVGALTVSALTGSLSRAFGGRR